MTALVITKTASAALTDMIHRILVAGHIAQDEVPDVVAVLKAIRAKHHDEVREARGHRWTAAIHEFRKDGHLPARFCEAAGKDEDATPCA